MPNQNKEPVFAITGITGQVGGVLAKTLLAAGKPVRAVVRSAEKGKPWADRGCEVAIADMADSAALAKAFAGAQGVFVLLPPVFAPAPGFPESKTVIAALKAALTSARPAKIVALSTIGAQATRPNLLTQLQLLEQALSELPIPVAFLRAAWFMENFAWDVKSAMKQGVVASFLQPLDQLYPMVATADIGRVAAELLQQDWTGKKIVELEGPQRISPNDVAATFSKLLGRAVRVEAVPREKWDALFVAQGSPNVEPRILMLEGFNQGWICFQSDESQTLKGKVRLENVLGELIARGRADA
jgi:uncharacterized protein YbjT (DUF2867 family)